MQPLTSSPGCGGYERLGCSENLCSAIWALAVARVELGGGSRDRQPLNARFADVQPTALCMGKPQMRVVGIVLEGGMEVVREEGSRH
jgi:hypothetical protein